MKAVLNLKQTPQSQTFATIQMLLVTGDISVPGHGAGISVTFKNWASFMKSINHINDIFIDESEQIDIIVYTRSLIARSDNYSDA